MSKFLKFIVGLILVVFIAAGAALIVPQFVGNVDTIIVQQGMISNKTIGSVIYAKKEATENIQVGDQVVDMDNDSLYVHDVVSFDYGTNIAQVTGGADTTIRLGDAFTRAVVTIPLIGYLTIATQSLPGLILLGLLLALVIVLFIVSEALRRDDDDEDDEDDDIFGGRKDRYQESEDDKFYRELAEKKRQTESMKEIKDALPQPTPPAGLFGDDEGNDGASEKSFRSNRTSDDGMMELSHSVPPVEEPAAGKDEKPLGTGELPDVQAALEAALENQQLNRYEHPQSRAVSAEEQMPADEEVIPGGKEEIELAMPVHTAEELMSKAYSAGMEPKMHKDKSGVTFVDYSDCL